MHPQRSRSIDAWSRVAAAALVLSTLTVAVPAAQATTGHAHPAGTAETGTAQTEAALLAEETALYGEAHAAEHARQRAALVPEQEGAVAPPGGPPAGEAVQAADDPPAVVGRWTQAPFDLPLMAINAVMLHTGKVLLFSYPRRDFTSVNYGAATLWDPRLGTGANAFTRVDPPIDPATGKPANIFCAGQTLLADGRVLVAGGNKAYENSTNKNYAGLERLYTFNPTTETWNEEPRMRQGRWYPTLIRLPDGRVPIISGLDERQTGAVNRDVELFTPSATAGTDGRLTLIGGHNALGSAGRPPTPGLYPHMFSMRSGRVLVAGPKPEDSWFFRAPGADNALNWTDAPNLPQRRTYASAVPLPAGTSGPNAILLTGGHAGDGQARTTSLVFQENTNGNRGAWRTAPNALTTARSNHNTKLLPGGSMVTVGGGVGSKLWTGTAAHRNVELRDPATGAWTVGPAQRETRAYHSTAVLLPDGRVLSAGDDINTSPGPGGETRDGRVVDTGEIYSPPYLFKGPRPTIASAPATARLNSTFTVGYASGSTAAADRVTRAVLVAPSAVTHGVDMNQRHVELAVTANAAGSLTLRAPASGNVAPPGYYMLFLLSERGVPSVARFMRVTP